MPRLDQTVGLIDAPCNNCGFRMQRQQASCTGPTEGGPPEPACSPLFALSLPQLLHAALPAALASAWGKEGSGGSQVAGNQLRSHHVSTTVGRCLCMVPHTSPACMQVCHACS